MAKTILPQPTGFNINPAPVNGAGGAFGKNIGVIGAPPSIYDQLKSNVPNYAGMTQGAGADIGSELAGRLSPGTTNLLQDKAAAFGIQSGMPGGTPGNTLTNQNFLNNLGMTSEGLAHQGLTDYNQFSGTTGSEQSDPNLLNSIAEQNAVDAAAPNPAAAQSYAESLFNKYMNPPKSKFDSGGSGIQLAGESNAAFNANPGEWDYTLGAT